MKESLSNAINLYPAKIEDIRIIAESLPIIIQEVTNAYHNKLTFDVKMKFHLFVGGFGSNAFVERRLLETYFCGRKITSRFKSPSCYCRSRNRTYIS